MLVGILSVYYLLLVAADARMTALVTTTVLLLGTAEDCLRASDAAQAVPKLLHARQLHEHSPQTTMGHF